METVTISAKLKNNKKVEFLQTMESLKTLVKSYCNDLDLKINPDNNLVIEITFDGKEKLENNFYNSEFNILKGTVKSLCEDVKIKIGDALVS